MKWYVTNGVDVKSFETHSEALEFIEANNDWWEVMA